MLAERMKKRLIEITKHTRGRNFFCFCLKQMNNQNKNVKDNTNENKRMSCMNVSFERIGQ